MGALLNIEIEAWKRMIGDINKKERSQYNVERKTASLRRLVSGSFAVLQQKLDEGWKMSELAEMIRRETKIKFKDKTLFNYMQLARKELSPSRKSRRRKKVDPVPNPVPNPVPDDVHDDVHETESVKSGEDSSVDQDAAAAGGAEETRDGQEPGSRNKALEYMTKTLNRY